MKHLLFFLFLIALPALADGLLPEGTESEAPDAERVEAKAVVDPTAVLDPLPEAAADNPAPALPPAESSIAIQPVPPSSQAPAATAGAPAPAPEFVPGLAPASEPESMSYGPTADEGYGSVGLKNDGGILQVGHDAVIAPDPGRAVGPTDSGDRQTSSVPPGESEDPIP